MTNDGGAGLATRVTDEKALAVLGLCALSGVSQHCSHEGTDTGLINRRIQCGGRAVAGKV